MLGGTRRQLRRPQIVHPRGPWWPKYPRGIGGQRVRIAGGIQFFWAPADV